MRTHAINISCILICFVVCQFSWTDDVPTIPVNLNSPVADDGVVPIVINNTDAWHGACVAIRDFELETWENYWQQTDANHQILKFKNTVNIFEDWYNPIITNTGRNKIIVLYQMFDGSLIKGEAYFDTYELLKQLKSDQLTEIRRIFEKNLIPSTSGVDFPPDGYISGEATISTPNNNFIAKIENNLNITSYQLSKASIFFAISSLNPAFSAASAPLSFWTAIIGLVCDTGSRILHAANSIEIHYQYSQYIPENQRPGPNQTYRLSAYIPQDEHIKNVIIYDDLDWDGFVGDRREVKVALPYSILHAPKYEFKVTTPTPEE